MNLPELKTISLTQSGAVLRACFSNPPLNLISIEMTMELKALADALEDQNDVKVVVFESADPEFFLAHFDLNPIKAWPAQGEVTTPSFFAAIVDRFRAMKVISIAMVDGIARGGGSEFLLALDMVFASERARFNQLEVAIGIIPGGGATARLPQRIGRNRALEVITSARDFSAQEAADYGWINRALPQAELADYVISLAERIADFPAATLAEAKRITDQAMLSTQEALVGENQANTRLIEQNIPQGLIDTALANGAHTREGELAIETMINALRGKG